MDREEILEKVRENREEVESFGVETLLLTGSHARGDHSEDSDIDFVVEFREGRGGADDYFGLLHLLEDLLDSDIDLVKRHLVREELEPSLVEGEGVEAAV